ncbi:MAG: TonB family protein [Verrucomicrobiota bacterium]|nr:TonB family protein [Verrucomicrobiota bacterium]
MNKLRVVLFFGLLVVVIAIARYNSKPKSQAESPIFPASGSHAASSAAVVPATSPSPLPAATSSPQPNQSADFHKAAERVSPAVILVSVFDGSGKLLRTGTGFFVSDDGKFVTSKYVVEGGANAVAKTTDGRIYNVSGVLAEGNALDLAVLKAEPKKQVPFLVPNKSALTEQGARIAVIGSPLTRRSAALFEGTISARRSDQAGERLELAAAVPSQSIGSPVINGKGEVIGVVTSQDGPGAVANMRTSNELDSILAGLGTGAAAGWQAQISPLSPLPPAEGPLPTPPPRKQKIPLAGSQTGGARLVYSPTPQYPNAARNVDSPIKGSGRYRLTFNAKGDVTDIQIIQSARNPALDGAATAALRKWKAAPGQQWQATVPITFQP